MEPIEDVCERGSKVMVADAMHIPENSEYIQESDTLEKALNYYVMGVHQPSLKMVIRSQVFCGLATSSKSSVSAS